MVLGRQIRDARRRRHLTQSALGDRVGLSRMSISRAERGQGAGLTLDAWQRISVALGMPMRFTFQRDPQRDTGDAGHLAMQELVLRTARSAGYAGTFELPTRPAEPWRSIDVGLRDDRARRLVATECWNTFGDIGAAARVSKRKLAEADRTSRPRAGGRPRTRSVSSGSCGRPSRIAPWSRDIRAFASLFPGASASWVRALTTGGASRHPSPVSSGAMSAPPASSRGAAASTGSIARWTTPITSR